MDYFAKIQEPKKLRISLMKAARDSIVSMALVENIEELRSKKLILIDGLKEDFKEIETLQKEMETLIADEKVRKDILDSAHREEKFEHEEVKSVSKKEDKKKEELKDVKKENKSEAVHTKDSKEQKAKTEVDRLEYTLSQIEQKIANLSK